MKLPIQLIKNLHCPYCNEVVDGSQVKPMSVIDCPACGERVNVPGVFGHYLIYQRVEREPLSAIYRAFDNTLERSVSLRILDPDGEPEVTAALIDLSRQLAAIMHKHVAMVHLVGDHEHIRYIENELLLGGSLQDLINTDDDIGELEAMEIMQDVALGLETVHHRGIFHLDVSPTHIRFDSQGMPKLTGFSQHRLKESKRKLIGSPIYVAPEAALFATGRDDAGSPNHLSDIFSLGACFYHVLAGVAPFEGKRAMDIVKARFRGRPPKLSMIRSIHPQTDQLIRAMMEPKSENRPQTISEVLDYLESHLALLEEAEQQYTTNTTSVLTHLNHEDDVQTGSVARHPHQDFDPGERTLSMALASVTSESEAGLSTRVLKPTVMDVDLGKTGSFTDMSELEDCEVEEAAASATNLHGNIIDEALDSLADLASAASRTNSFENLPRHRARTASRKNRQNTVRSRKSASSARMILAGAALFVVSLFSLVMIIQATSNSVDQLAETNTQNISVIQNTDDASTEVHVNDQTVVSEIYNPPSSLETHASSQSVIPAMTPPPVEVLAINERVPEVIDDTANENESVPKFYQWVNASKPSSSPEAKIWVALTDRKTGENIPGYGQLPRFAKIPATVFKDHDVVPVLRVNGYQIDGTDPKGVRIQNHQGKAIVTAGSPFVLIENERWLPTLGKNSFKIKPFILIKEEVNGQGRRIFGETFYQGIYVIDLQVAEQDAVPISMVAKDATKPKIGSIAPSALTPVIEVTTEEVISAPPVGKPFLRLVNSRTLEPISGYEVLDRLADVPASLFQSRSVALVFEPNGYEIQGQPANAIRVWNLVTKKRYVDFTAPLSVFNQDGTNALSAWRPDARVFSILIKPFVLKDGLQVFGSDFRQELKIVGEVLAHSPTIDKEESLVLQDQDVSEPPTAGTFYVRLVDAVSQETIKGYEHLPLRAEVPLSVFKEHNVAVVFEPNGARLSGTQIDGIDVHDILANTSSTDQTPPYQLVNTKTKINGFSIWRPGVGQYGFHLVIRAGDKKLKSMQHRYFIFVPEPGGKKIALKTHGQYQTPPSKGHKMFFTLVDVATKSPIPGFTHLTGRHKLPLSIVRNHQVTLVFHVSDELTQMQGEVERVEFDVNGLGQTESVPPYTVFGDWKGRLLDPWILENKPANYRVNSKCYFVKDKTRSHNLDIEIMLTE